MILSTGLIKDINKLQLEGLVKAGAFDNIIQNRKSLYESIPSIILKSKNNHENKIANQINLLKLKKLKIVKLYRLLKTGISMKSYLKNLLSFRFYISDHPLNQYSDVLSDYKL